MEIVILLVVALVVLAGSIRVGMLLAPRVERMADRANREDPAQATDADPPQNLNAEHEEHDDRSA